MASVLVLLLAVFCGVYTASLPDSDALDSKLDSTLDSKLDSTTDGLDPQISDNIKQTVLEGVKKLLDSQLAALVKDKERNTEAQRRTYKSRSNSLLSKQKEKINQDFSTSEDLQNSKLVKSYTDDVQDPGVESLTNAIDELLKENKDIILEDKDEIILDNNVDNLLDLENSTNIDNGEIISRVGYDEISSQLAKHNNKDRKANKSHNRKKGNRVIVDRLSKIKENHDNRHTSEDNSEEKLNEYNENVKTLSDSHSESLNSRKKSKHNKVRKNQIDLRENGRNLDTFINRLDQLIKKENDLQGNKNKNVNIVHPIYQRGQKYGRLLHGPSKTLPNKYIRNGNRHKYYKLAKKLPSETVTSNIDVRKSWSNDVNGQNYEQNSLHNKLSKFGLAQGKHETNKTKNAYTESSNKSANNDEETDIFTEYKDAVRDKLGKDKESGKEAKKSVSEEKITANNNDDAKVKGTEAKNQNQANPVESDESVDEKHTLQETGDNAATDTNDPANAIADKEENISVNEEDVTENENISSEKENVAGETNDGKETDKDYILDFLENTQNTDTNKKDTKDKLTKNNDVNVSKKDISRNCHESDESRILRELIQNNAIKKSFLFSLNFTSQ